MPKSSMAKSKGISSTAYRRKKGYTRQRLSFLKGKGKIVTTADGKIDEQASDAKIHAAQRNAASFQQPNQIRQVKDFYDARLAKLEYEQKVGKLLVKEEVQRETFRVARIVRDAILNVPNRLAGPLAAESDQHKILTMLKKELMQALEKLKEEVPVK